VGSFDPANGEVITHMAAHKTTSPDLVGPGATGATGANRSKQDANRSTRTRNRRRTGLRVSLMQIKVCEQDPKKI
jgi:hypothetical protein